MQSRLSAIFLFLTLFSSAQQITASFVAPDNVCVNEPFTVQNTTPGTPSNVSIYYWEACLNSAPAPSVAADLGNPGGILSGPSFFSINEESGNYYMFICSNFSGRLARLSFGSSLTNSPTAVDLGNLAGNFPSSPEGIYIEKEGANWYGIVIGGTSGAICRLSFGNSLLNTPTAANDGNIGTLSYPVSLNVFTSGGNKYALISNYSGNSITRLSFGISYNNTPTGVNLGNIGSLNSPTQMTIINYAGNWHAFVNNSGSNTLTRFDFGNNLLSVPTGTNLGNPGNLLNTPRGLNLSVGCNSINGWAGNRADNLLMTMTFTAGATGPVSLNSLGSPGNIFDPHTIGHFREGNNSILFVVDGNAHRLTRITYAGCNAIPVYTTQNIPSLSFSVAGTYTLQLITNEGMYNQSAYCKTINVTACLSIPDRSGESGVTVFPNPSRDIYTLKTEKQIQVKLFDAYGILILEKNYLPGEHLLSLAGQSSGIYVLEISSSNKIINTKLVKID